MHTPKFVDISLILWHIYRLKGLQIMMYWHLQWQKLTPSYHQYNGWERNSTRNVQSWEEGWHVYHTTQQDLFKRILDDYSSAHKGLIVRKKKNLKKKCDLVSHSNRITSKESNPNYVTTFHVQPLWSHYKAVPQLFCLKWRPVTTKRYVRDQKRKLWWSNTSKEEWMGFRVDTRHSMRRHLLFYNCRLK